MIFVSRFMCDLCYMFANSLEYILYTLLNDGGRDSLVANPYYREGNREFRMICESRHKDVFVFPVSLSYQSFDAVAIYCMSLVALWNADQDLNSFITGLSLGNNIHTAQRIGCQ